MFNIEYKKYGAVVVGSVYATQVVDAASVASFGDDVIAFLERHPNSHLMLNFSRVDYMSSAMLSELLRINEVVRRQRGSLRLCGLRKEMREVFQITRLDAMFHIDDDCKEALKRYHAEVKGASPGKG